MSISSSLSNAFSGLSAASRAAEVISSNIANASTPGYGKRELVLTTQTNGGVLVETVSRGVNQTAIYDRRLADASLGESATVVDFFASIEQVIGTPGDSDSLTAKISSFESSLISASASPESAATLSAVLTDATQIVEKINQISTSIQEQRSRADTRIGSQVDQINASLSNISDLNKDIRRQFAVGGDTASLMDQRQMEIDKISEFIPVRELPRDFGEIALMTENGSVLVDDKAAQLEFTPTAFITPDMTLSSGALSGLNIVGAASSTGDAYFAIEGGALSANFDLRDTITVEAQTQLDALARNLVERFSGPTADSTLASGQAGIFTDAGADFDPLNEENLASRLSVNDIVNPDAGGDISKIRDGIGSTVSGPVGDGSVLATLKDALNASQSPASGFFATSGTFSVLTTDVISQFSSQRLDAETRLAHDTSRVTALVDLENQSGVSTDDELQKLLVVERAYAANAKIIQTVDEMIQAILRI